MIRALAGALALVLALAAPAAAFDIQSSTTPGNAPAALSQGEIAINRADRTLFFKNVDGSLEPGFSLGQGE